MILLLLALTVLPMPEHPCSFEDNVQKVEGTLENCKITNKADGWWIEWTTKGGRRHYRTSCGKKFKEQTKSIKRAMKITGRVKL